MPVRTTLIARDHTLTLLASIAIHVACIWAYAQIFPSFDFGQVHSSRSVSVTFAPNNEIADGAEILNPESPPGEEFAPIAKVKPVKNAARNLASRPNVSGESAGYGSVERLSTIGASEQRIEVSHDALPSSEEPEIEDQKNRIASSELRLKQDSDAQVTSQKSLDSTVKESKPLFSKELSESIVESDVATHTPVHETSDNKVSSNDNMVDTYRAASYELGSALTPRPDYPGVALMRGWQGEVILDVHVAASGSVEKVRVVQSSGYSILDDEALKTIQQSWSFEPATRFEKGTFSIVRVPISFQINRLADS